MSCEKYHDLLIAYMDGRAADEQRADVDRHLLACSSCRTRMEEYRRVWVTLDQEPAPEISPAFDARLRARIAAEPKPSWLDWLPAPRMAFAASLLLALSIWVGSGSKPQTDMAMNPNMTPEEELRAVKDLQRLEDLDVLVNFEALAELPPTPQQKM